jgi:predicted metal-dependent hydrolase
VSEVLEVAGLRVVVRRSQRRKTIGLVIDRTGDVIVSAPSSADSVLLANWVARKSVWVHGKLNSRSSAATHRSPPEFVSGESFAYLGRWYPLVLVADQPDPLTWDGLRFRLRRSAQASAFQHFRRWYARHGALWARERIHLWTRRVGVTVPDLRVRELGFRWGSCAKDGAVFLNWKTLQLPRRLIDYVLVHELAHRRFHNHGPAFRALLDRSMSDWTVRAGELDRSATNVHWCVPAAE